MNLPGTQGTGGCHSDMTRRWHRHGGARLGFAWEENPTWELGQVQPQGQGQGQVRSQVEDKPMAYLW